MGAVRGDGASAEADARVEPPRAPDPPVRRPSAASALALGTVLAGVALAVGPGPAHWSVAERTLDPTALSPAPLVSIVHALARLIPVGELSQRLDALVAVLLLGNAAAASWVGFTLFRGRGRMPGAIAAGPVCVAGLARWAQAAGAPVATPGLVVSLVAMLAAAEVVRSRVRFGHVTPRATATALALTTAITVIDPRAASVLVLLTIVTAVITTRRALRRGAAARRWIVATTFALVPVLSAVVVTLLVLTPRAGPLPWPSLATLHIVLPTPGLVDPYLAAVLVYPALALLLLTIVVLRWRGGPWLAAWATVPACLADANGPLVPLSVGIAVLAVATAGWAWLAGTAAAPRKYRSRAGALAMLGSLATAGVVMALALDLPTRTPSRPVAQTRPVGSLVRLYARGMLAPGDVLVANDPWLAAAIEDRKATEGWRPDVLLLRTPELDAKTLAGLSRAWHERGRRILSDGWHIGPDWDASRAVDSGPLFWFVGALDPADREYTDLQAFFPDPKGQKEQQRRRWTRLAIERSRFRRATGDPHAALSALPLEARRYRSLQTRLQLARSARAEAGAGSELPGPLPEPDAIDDAALILAEAGDILFSHGEHERATELLIEAGNSGYATAWGALVRWQLRAGQTSAAESTARALASEPTLRGEAVDLLRWLLLRDRVADAMTLARTLAQTRPDRPGAPSVSASEAAARLSLLARQATRPPPPPIAAPPTTSARR